MSEFTNFIQPDEERQKKIINKHKFKTIKYTYIYCKHKTSSHKIIQYNI